jgi:predicted dehydrogenase
MVLSEKEELLRHAGGPPRQARGAPLSGRDAMSTATEQRLRFGVLGAAQIAPTALIDPATRLDVDVVAIAARDPQRAKEFADLHGIRSVSRSYEELVERDDLDAVYLPLPAAFRFEWTMQALEHGLHVLAEKPIAMNAGQAREMVDEAEARGLVLAEGFHYVFHPMFARALKLLYDSTIGEIEHIEAVFDGAAPSGPEAAIYLDPALGGGALLHQGCYPLHAVRSLAGVEPEVVRARATIGETGVDESVDVDLVFPSGVTGRARSSMAEGTPLSMQATVRGSRALMTLDNFIGPHAGSVMPSLGGRISVTTDSDVLLDESFGGETTYWYQLRAFCEAVSGGPTLPVQGEGAVANMTLIDEVRAAAGI